MKKNHTIENGIPICAYDGCWGCNICCPYFFTEDTKSDDQIKYDIKMCEQDECRGCGRCMKRGKKLL